MKSCATILFAVILGVFLSSPPISAHHSAASFDVEHPITMTGTVTDFVWTNPHAFIHLNVKDDKGNVEDWRVEANSPNMLSRAGWRPEMIQPGDQLTVTGAPAKNGKKILRLNTLTLANGQKFDGQGFK